MRNFSINGLMALALVAGLPLVASASSHREAPSIANDPAADNTDLYAWMNPAGTRLNVVANWIPLEEPSGGPNFHRFSENVLYEINIARGATLDAALKYQFRFTRLAPAKVDPADLDAPLGGGKEFFIQLAAGNQVGRAWRVDGEGKSSLGKFEVAPPNIGPRTDAVIRGGVPYDDAYAATFITDMGDGSKLWAGPRDDGFYVDLGGIFDLANLRGTGVAQDGVAGFNTHSIAISIPIDQIPEAADDGDAKDVVGIWATSSRRQVTIRKTDGRSISYGPWVQVSRLGFPLINEAVIGLQDKDRFNATHPKDDVANFGAYILNPVVVRDAAAVGIYDALDQAGAFCGETECVPASAAFGLLASNRVDIINTISIGKSDVTVGDVLRVDLTAASAFPNGRPIPGGGQANQEQSDVTDVILSVITAGLLHPDVQGALESVGAAPIFVGDGVDYNDKDFLPSMPWLPAPHRGFDEGHGTTTPGQD